MNTTSGGTTMMTMARHGRSASGRGRLALTVMAAALAAAVTAAQTAGPREGHADAPGVRLWHTDSGGSGQAVVFVHAATGSSRVWEYQRPAFTARGYRVITYDRRGYGRTEAAPSGPQPGTGADDLKGLLDALKLDRVHLVGSAAGGIVSLDFAVSFPDRLRSLVIANSIGGVQDPSYVELGRRLRPEPFNKMPPDFRELGPSYRAGNPEGTARWIALEHISRPEGAVPITQTYRNQLTFALLERITAPTLFLTGDADLYSPPAVLPLFQSRVKGSQSVVLPGAGHSAYWEQPEAFNRTVLEFIAKH